MKEWGLERYEIRTFPSIIWVSYFPSFIPELRKEEVPKHYCDSTNNKLHISSREWALTLQSGLYDRRFQSCGITTSSSNNWLTSCVIRTGLIGPEIPQSLSHQRLLEDVVLAKVLRMIFSKFFFVVGLFFIKKKFWLCPKVCGILVSQPVIELLPPALETVSLKSPECIFFW